MRRCTISVRMSENWDWPVRMSVSGGGDSSFSPHLLTAGALHMGWDPGKEEEMGKAGRGSWKESDTIIFNYV